MYLYGSVLSLSICVTVPKSLKFFLCKTQNHYGMVNFLEMHVDVMNILEGIEDVLFFLTDLYITAYMA